MTGFDSSATSAPISPALQTFVELADIEAAALRIAGVAVRTPLVAAPWLAADATGNTAAGRVWLKLEMLQPIGAFKIRGAYNKIARLPEAERERGVIAHSSGNHAQAVAYAARSYGIPATIVIPDSAPANKIAATRALGAQVVLVAAADRYRAAEELAERDGLVMVPPFDDLDVIAGQGTIGLEILEQLGAQAPLDPRAEALRVRVLVPVSGGGLISGVAAAVKAQEPRAEVIGVQSELAAHASESIRAGYPISWPAAQTVRTVADALRAGTLGTATWAHIHTLVDDIVTVTEDAILDAVRDLALRSHVVVEPGGAVGAAAIRSDAIPQPAIPDVEPVTDTVVICSGGNVASDVLVRALARAD